MSMKKEQNKWLPLVLRNDSREYFDELNRRLIDYAILSTSSEEGKNTAGKLKYFGNLLFTALERTGLNPTEFAKLAGVNERKFFFAQVGLLSTEEFLEEEFLSKVDNGFKEHFGLDINSSKEAARLLTSN